MYDEKIIYLTFDMDWACNELMDFLYNLLEKYDLQATINVTNDFELMKQYKQNNKIELGIHPNFNFVLNGTEQKGKEQIVKECKELVPDAVVVRSHSLVNSTPLTQLFYDNGIRYELNYYIPPQPEIYVKPWKLEGVLQVPFLFEDDLYLMERNIYTPEFYLDRDIHMLRVFNFHPIHLYLNCENIDRYYKIKNNYKDYNILKYNVNLHSYGMYNFFLDLIELSRNQGYRFETISKIGEFIS